MANGHVSPDRPPALLHRWASQASARQVRVGDRQTNEETDSTLPSRKAVAKLDKGRYLSFSEVSAKTWSSTPLWKSMAVDVTHDS